MGSAAFSAALPDWFPSTHYRNPVIDNRLNAFAIAPIHAEIHRARWGEVPHHGGAQMICQVVGRTVHEMAVEHQ